MSVGIEDGDDLGDALADLVENGAGRSAATIIAGELRAASGAFVRSTGIDPTGLIAIPDAPAALPLGRRPAADAAGAEADAAAEPFAQAA